MVRLRTIGIPNFIDLGPWDYTIVQNSACSGLLLFFLMPRCMFVRPGGVGPIELIWYIWGALSFQDFPKKKPASTKQEKYFCAFSASLLSSRSSSFFFYLFWYLLGLFTINLYHYLRWTLSNTPLIILVCIALQLRATTTVLVGLSAWGQTSMG